MKLPLKLTLHRISIKSLMLITEMALIRHSGTLSVTSTIMLIMPKSIKQDTLPVVKVRGASGAQPPPLLRFVPLQQYEPPD